MMKHNKLRQLLNENKPTIATRMWSTSPFFTEALGATGQYDYVEFLAEYASFTQHDLDHVVMAAELHNMGSMIKIDFHNRAYVAQKALGSGFQSVLFTDCKTAEDVRESVSFVKPETEPDRGGFGYPNRRFIGFQPQLAQMDHAQRLRDIVIAFMVEKKATMDNIEAICAIPGVDMVQFGPSDYSMSRGWNSKDHFDEFKAAEREMIKVALKNGVRPRCEIHSVDAAKYYIDLGVKDFCIGDQLKILQAVWNADGSGMRALVETLK